MKFYKIKENTKEHLMSHCQNNHESLSESSTLLHLLGSFKHTTYELQKAHWLVAGKEFYRLHEEFDHFYNWSFEAEDEIAELIIRLNEEKSIPVDLQKLISHSLITPINTTNNQTIVKDVLRIFHELKDALLKGVQVFENKPAVEGKLIDILSGLEDFEWKLSRYNAK